MAAMSALEAGERGLCCHCCQPVDMADVPLCRSCWGKVPQGLRTTILRGHRWKTPAFYGAWRAALAALERAEGGPGR